MDLEKEKREAIEAGNKAMNSLRLAQSELEKASGWGIFDMLGGGLLSTAIKHDKMYNAQKYMEEAKYNLQNFSRELSDVNMICNLNLELGDFINFADWFFDGFIADWLVQSRISEARNQVEKAMMLTGDVLRRLENL